MVTVGVVANPASGRDVRRLVTGASVFDNAEKVDPDRDADLLRQFDVDPAALVETFSGQSPEVG